MKDGVILRGERILIPEELRGNVLGAGHEGHPGREVVVKQLKKFVWWSGMEQDVK